MALHALGVPRNAASVVSLALVFAVTAAGCKGNVVLGNSGVPRVDPGGQSGPGSVTVTVDDNNPCAVTVDFGDIPISQTETATIFVTNTGAGNLDISLQNPTLNAEFTLNFGNQPPIVAGAHGEFTASFTPYQVGPVSSDFTVITDGVNSLCGSGSSNVDVTLKGNGIQLSLTVDPNPLDFGNTLINTTSKKSVTLTNTSSAAVSGITATLGGSDANLFQLGTVPDTLAAGDSASIDISYAPLALQTRSFANVVFAISTGSNGKTQNEVTLSLFGEPVGVALTVSPNPINFGFVPLSTTQIACATVTNQSNVTVTVESIGSFASEFNAFAIATTDDATPPNPITYPLAIDSGANAKVCFTLTPTNTQQYQGSGTLVTQGDPSGNNPVVNLTGWGGGPQISCAPASIDFGQTLDHSISTVPVLCTNVGTAIPGGVNLLISSVTASPVVFSADFDQSHDPYPINGLAPGQTAQIDVNYAPVGSSNDKGTVFIKNNGGQGKEVQIPLTGQGLNVPPCQFVVAPSALNFANVQVGDISTSLAFEIENVGTDICLVQGLTIKNDATSAFHILSTSIQPDAVTGKITIPAPAPGVTSSLTVTLNFAPIQQGAFSAEAAFGISDPTDPNQVVPLTGTSESSCLVIAPPGLNFGDVGENDAGVICSSASRTFSIFNECQTAATVQSLTVQNGPGDIVHQFSQPAGPALPLTIQPGSPAVVYELFFEPTTLGTHTAQLLISDGTVDNSLPLAGAAVSTGTETDSFVVGPPKADILFVIDVDDDPTEQAAIVAAAPSFFTAAAGIDYRVAVTTDDDDAANSYAEFGRLLPCPTCSMVGPAPTIISPSSVPAGGTAPDPTTAFTDLLSAVRNDAYPTGTPTDEHFFLALYNALQHGPQPGVDFYRPGVFFAGITDNGDNEPDSSELGKGNHNPTWFANFFETYFENPFLFTWNYINPTQTVTGTGFSNYLQLPPSIQQMISATNGFALNTSDSQWATALTSVWTSAIEAHTYYPLVGTPSEGDNGIVVTRNGQNIPQYEGSGTNNPNWTFQATINSIVFTANDPPQVGDQISVTYPIGCK